MTNILSIITEKLKTRYNQTYRMNKQSDSERRKLYMDERFLSDLVASGFEQVRQQAEEKHKKNRREEQGMRKRTNITCSERYYQMRNRLNPKVHNYQTEKHRTIIEHFTGTIIDTEREVQNFINYH